MNLYRETLKLVKRSDLKPEEIAKKSRVKVRWFYDFINKKVKEPGVHKVQRIFDYLSK